MTDTGPAQSLSSALTKYYYDNLYQLSRADYPNGPPFNGEVHSWTYDAIGNRQTNTVNSVTQNYTYQKLGASPNNWQWLTSDGTNAYTYDANGNTASRTGYSFGWDYENRLSSIGGASNASYTYDYSGRRSSKTVSGVATNYMYDGLDLVAENSRRTANSHLLGSGIDAPLATNRGAAIVYHSIDAVGSIGVTVDVAAVVQNSYAYDSGGVARVSSETFPQPFRYTGREMGDLQDFDFYRSRFYSHSIGRFLSEDVLRSEAGPSFFAYVMNDPLNWTDPTGLQCYGRWMLVTAYSDHGPGRDWPYYRPAQRGGQPRGVGPHTVAVS